MVLLALQVCTAQPGFCCAGDGIQGFVLASQALYDLRQQGLASQALYDPWQQGLAMRHHALSKNKDL